MSTARTQQFFDELGTGLQVIETGEDTSTVPAAAAALGVLPGQIAKTLAMRAGETVFLLVARGDARIDNRKFKDRYGAKPRMLPADETHELTGQPVGGVGPFGHVQPLTLFLDESLRDFDAVYPAAGSRSSAFRITPDELGRLTGAEWVDVCS
ncbi:MAG TPA: YbaK/EbsC family protein [Propionibacteriaceae bacterium]|nr:YbaK/EbsC family protein [Propionibacteriaceae bacterium]